LAWFTSSLNVQARESNPSHLDSQKQIRPSPSILRRGPVERLDLSRALGPLLCVDKSPDPKALWEMGIFDAQIEGLRLSSKGHDKDVLLATAQKKSRILARMKHFGGYAYGVCADGSIAWGLAVPSPEPISSISDSGKFPMPMASLKARCESFRVDFANEDGGQPKTVPLGKNKLASIAGMGRGVLSVTCQPRAPRWQGPVLWALVPSNKSIEFKIPFSPNGQPRSIEDGLRHWIGQIRAKEGLAPLMIHPELQHYGDLLAIDGSLRHNRTQLNIVARKLRHTTTSPLGEDRVRAQDLASMVWLLWNSPRHRGLLLDPAASSLGIGTKNLGSETLAVILTGKTEQKTTVLRQGRGQSKSLR
jgi:hypothetical protein